MIQKTKRGRQTSLFEEQRLTLLDAIELSLDSLREYGRRYRHWTVAYSGGKDSSATVTFIAWAIREGLVPAPASLAVFYADTRQELPPLHASAMALLAALDRDGIKTRVVLPPLDERFYVYMLGYGVPPPSNTFRWCTSQLKIEPMMAVLEEGAVKLAYGEMVYDDRYQKMRYQGYGREGEKFLMLTGVRLGESEVRDQRIAVSCSKDSGECGQGWFQVATPEALADTLAPLLHWRLCHIFDWLYFEERRHGYPEVAMIADVYGEEDIRTGCIGCPLASRDNALERLVKKPEWLHLTPLLELKPFFREMKLSRWRKRKAVPETRKDGTLSKNGQRKGPLTMEARRHWLDRVLDVQHRVNDAAADRPGVNLINAEEEARIREMWALDMWPQKWSADDIRADVPIDKINVTAAGDLITQPLLVR